MKNNNESARANHSVSTGSLLEKHPCQSEYFEELTDNDLEEIQGGKPRKKTRSWSAFAGLGYQAIEIAMEE